MTTTMTQNETATWNLDAGHTSVEFAVKHMMITTVKGRFAGLSGALTLNEKNRDQSSVAAEFAAASIDTRNEQRDQHLKSADFFDVEQFPTLTFVSRRVEGLTMKPGSTFRLIGDLTMRDKTREVALDATFEGQGKDPWGGERVSFSASGIVDRRDFGLTWNAALETGGVLVAHEVKIQIEAQAVRAV
ncbi:MAG: YceI family protein [Gemmatimonadales bacterium]